MTLEQQCCSLDLAKRLKELGIKRGKSYFLWEEGDGEMDRGFEWRLVIDDGKSHTFGQKIPAFTVAELGEMLKEYELECIWFPEHEKWGAFQTCSGIEPLLADTEADARASLLIYLLENNLLPASHRGGTNMNEIMKDISVVFQKTPITSEPDIRILYKGEEVGRCVWSSLANDWRIEETSIADE